MLKFKKHLTSFQKISLLNIMMPKYFCEIEVINTNISYFFIYNYIL